jgi:hypothetical protein
MIIEIVGRNTDDLHVPLLEIFVSTSDLSELRRADGGEITRV